MAKDDQKPTMGFDSVLVSAEAFHGVALELMPRIHMALPESTKPETGTPLGLGTAVACATNLAFALELYIKAITLQLNLPFQKGHDLWELFSALPQEIRFDIELLYYDFVKQKQALQKPFSLTIAKGLTKPGSKASLPEWKQFSGEDVLLEGMLQRSRNAFVSWRYVFELKTRDGDDYQFHTLEYGLLDCACDALRMMIQSNCSEEYFADKTNQLIAETARLNAETKRLKAQTFATKAETARLRKKRSGPIRFSR